MRHFACLALQAAHARAVIWCIPCLVNPSHLGKCNPCMANTKAGHSIHILHQLTLAIPSREGCICWQTCLKFTQRNMSSRMFFWKRTIPKRNHCLLSGLAAMSVYIQAQRFKASEAGSPSHIVNQAILKFEMRIFQLQACKLCRGHLDVLCDAMNACREAQDQLLTTTRSRKNN